MLISDNWHKFLISQGLKSYFQPLSPLFRRADWFQPSVRRTWVYISACTLYWCWSLLVHLGSNCRLDPWCSWTSRSGWPAFLEALGHNGETQQGEWTEWQREWVWGKNARSLWVQSFLWPLPAPITQQWPSSTTGWVLPNLLWMCVCVYVGGSLPTFLVSQNTGSSTPVWHQD